MSEAEAPSLHVSTTETSPVLRTLEVEVDAARVRRAFDRAYRELSRSVRVKGFRPGKAPRKVLERLYGASLAEEIERTLVSETLPEAVERSGVVPVAEPTIESDKPSADAAFRYKASIEVKPAIELPELTGLPARRPRVEVDEEQVEQELASLRERRAPLVDEPEGTEASDGTSLTIDYRGTIDGEPFEGGSAEGAVVELGNDHYLPGFAEQLQGTRAGEEREVRVTFPEDYGAEDVRGKQAVFAVRVQKLQRREVPALDDAFVEGLGDENVKTVEELRARIREDLEGRAKRTADEEARRSLLGALIERTRFDVPPGLVDRRLAQRLEMAHQQLGQVMPHEELHARIDQWREEWRPDAERDVRETLLLEAVAEARGLEASDEEVDARLEQMARDQGIAPERLRKAYEERGLVGSLRARLREEKALEFLLAEAKVDETSGT